MGVIAMQKMGKASKWIRNLLGGKKDEEEKDRIKKDAAGPFSAENLASPASNVLPAATKEKQRWSLRRSASSDTSSRNSSRRSFDSAISKASHLQIQYGTTAVFPAAAPEPIKAILVAKPALSAPGPVEHAAATKIQSIFRSYLARKALCALRALVKLQALVRGYLVRRGTTATLRSMQALIAIQVRARVHRIQMAGDQSQLHPKRPTTLRQVISQDIHNQHKQAYVIKDVISNESGANSKSRSGHIHDHPQIERTEHGITRYSGRLSISKRDYQLQTSPNPSTSSETSSSALNTQTRESLSLQRNSRHNSPKEKTNQKKAPFGIPFPDYADQLAHHYPWLPNYMANTESSRAKVRSQSEPKQRPESSEKGRYRRSTSDEQIDIDIQTQRSSPQVKPHAQKSQYPWLIKLYHRSTKKAIKDSDCDSISARTTNASNKCKTIISSEPPVYLF